MGSQGLGLYMWVQLWASLDVQFSSGFLCSGCCAWVLICWHLGCWSARGLGASCIQFWELLVRLVWFGCSGSIDYVLGDTVFQEGLRSVVLVHWVLGVIWVPRGQVINCASLGVPLDGAVSFLDMVLMPVAGWLVCGIRDSV